MIISHSFFVSSQLAKRANIKLCGIVLRESEDRMIKKSPIIRYYYDIHVPTHSTTVAIFHQRDRRSGLFTGRVKTHESGRVGSGSGRVINPDPDQTRDVLKTS